VERADDDRRHSIESAKLVREQLLVGLDVRVGALQVQVQQHAREFFDDLFERRDPEITIRGSLAALDVVRGLLTVRDRRTGNPPVGVVHIAQLRQREVGYRPVMVRRAVDRVVVTDDEVSIRGGVDVEFYACRTLGERASNRGERRGRAFKGSTLVRKGDHPAFEPEIAHLAGSPSG